jgi:multiple sugar transport system permease protein
MTRSRERSSIWVGLLWISPWLVGFLAFMLIPVAMSLRASFTDGPLIEKPIPIGWANYERMAHDTTFHKTLINTFIYCAASIPLSTILALIVAALLNAKVRAGGFFQACVFIPTLVPLVASAMVWMWLFNGEYGLINKVLKPIWPAIAWATSWLPEKQAAVFAQPPNWLLDAHWSMAAVVIMSLWGIGQAVVIYIAALRQVPEALYEAAVLDGMGPVRKFLNITLPMISPVILFNVITLTIGSFQVFAVPYVIFQTDKGGPDHSAYFYTHYLYDNAFVYGQMGYANAMAWVQLLIILVLTGFMFLISRKAVFYRAG